ncbi:MAG: NTP transferase domain-containing protein, partial [Opitutales bacterium]
MKAELILLAAGSGQRMGGAVQDKVLAPVDGRPVLARALDAFLG